MFCGRVASVKWSGCSRLSTKWRIALPCMQCGASWSSDKLRRLGFDPMRDVQVLTPMHGGQLGTEALNTALQDALNPPAARGPLFTTVQGAEWVRRGRRLRVGDRVIQARNNYDLDIFNGDTGRIVGVEDAALEVDFDGRPLGLAGE